MALIYLRGRLAVRKDEREIEAAEEDPVQCARPEHCTEFFTLV